MQMVSVVTGLTTLEAVVASLTLLAAALCALAHSAAVVDYGVSLGLSGARPASPTNSCIVLIQPHSILYSTTACHITSSSAC